MRGNEPEWRNWQTQWIQNPSPARACGFESRLRHKSLASRCDPHLKRIHRRLFRINERIAEIEAETRQVEAELEYHRSINEDAQRDAAIGNYIDREEAGLTAADVRRFEKTISALNQKRAKLIDKRSQLLARLD